MEKLVDYLYNRYLDGDDEALELFREYGTPVKGEELEEGNIFSYWDSLTDIHTARGPVSELVIIH